MATFFPLLVVIIIIIIIIMIFARREMTRRKEIKVLRVVYGFPYFTPEPNPKRGKKKKKKKQQQKKAFTVYARIIVEF